MSCDEPPRPPYNHRAHLWLDNRFGLGVAISPALVAELRSNGDLPPFMQEFFTEWGEYQKLYAEWANQQQVYLDPMHDRFKVFGGPWLEFTMLNMPAQDGRSPQRFLVDSGTFRKMSPEKARALAALLVERKGMIEKMDTLIIRSFFKEE